MLAHPLTRGMPLDDPRTTALRGRIIREKGFLRQIYLTWYRLLLGHLPDVPGAVLEVGAGGGFLKDLQQDVITAETFLTPGVDLVCNAMALPFKTDSLGAILMVDVLHHIPDVALFFGEAARCVKSGGRCLFVEPWNTAWGRWVYQNLHHEPFNPDGGWSVPSGGPLSAANGALPWILFERDRELFRQRWPEWAIVRVIPMMPLAYLLAGGVSLRALMPAWGYRLIRGLERLIPGAERYSGMFALIVLERA